MALHPGDPGYETVYTAWLADHQPAAVRVSDVVYLQFLDGLEVFFVSIDPDDPVYLDPADPKGYWNRYYGYRRPE